MSAGSRSSRQSKEPPLSTDNQEPFGLRPAYHRSLYLISPLTAHGQRHLKFIEFFSAVPIFRTGPQQQVRELGVDVTPATPNFLFQGGERDSELRKRKIGRLVGTECIGHEKAGPRAKWAVMMTWRDRRSLYMQMYSGFYVAGAEGSDVFSWKISQFDVWWGKNKMMLYTK